MKKIIGIYLTSLKIITVMFLIMFSLCSCKTGRREMMTPISRERMDDFFDTESSEMAKIFDEVRSEASRQNSRDLQESMHKEHRSSLTTPQKQK